MMKSILDDVVPTHTLGYPLGKTLKIIFYFLIPPILLLVIYLNLIAADIALVFLHINDENPRWATSTLLLICWPAIVGFMFTISSPSLWPGNTPLAKENFKFLGVQLLHFCLFPLGVCYRYVYQIFWAIEATFASLRRDEVRREEALNILMQPNTMELYFFLQAYLHCAPQMLLQFYIMLRIYKPYSDTVRTQVLSISACLLQMAIITMTYQRFERRKVLGAEYPWSIYRKQLLAQYSEVNPYRPKPVEPELISNIVGIDLSRYSNATTVRADSVYNNNNTEHEETDSPMIKRQISNLAPIEEDHIEEMSDAVYNNNNITEHEESNSPMIKRQLSSMAPIEENHIEETVSKVSDKNDSDSEFYNDDVFYRVQNSPTLQNAESDDTSDIVQAEDNPKRKNLKVSIVDNEEVEQRRKDTAKSYNIVDMSMHVTPPETPAPRISLYVIRDRILNNAEMIMDKIPQRSYKDNNNDIALPVRVRETAIKGIAQEDGIAKFISFIAWWLFIMARMLSLVSFSYFYFYVSVYICIAHYLLMVLVLMCNSWNESMYRKFFYLFLGYIYLFCLIEFKMKFRKVRFWYGFYFTLVSSENFLMLAVWFWNGSWEIWWFGFIAVVILFSTFLSYMSFLSYFLLLKPRPMTVYPLLSTQSCSPAIID